MRLTTCRLTPSPDHPGLHAAPDVVQIPILSEAEPGIQPALGGEPSPKAIGSDAEQRRLPDHPRPSASAPTAWRGRAARAACDFSTRSPGHGRCRPTISDQRIPPASLRLQPVHRHMRTIMLKSCGSSVAAHIAASSPSVSTRLRLGIEYPSVPVTTLYSTWPRATHQPKNRDSAALVCMALVVPEVPRDLVDHRRDLLAPDVLDRLVVQRLGIGQQAKSILPNGVGSQRPARAWSCECARNASARAPKVFSPNLLCRLLVGPPARQDRPVSREPASWPRRRPAPGSGLSVSCCSRSRPANLAARGHPAPEPRQQCVPVRCPVP